MSHRTTRTVLVLATACATMLVFAASALAHGHRGDRNRDGIPDRWERANHLSLRFNQAHRDQDHDGLNNRGEFLAGDNPRDEDSNGDGTNDGNENAGTITSFTGGVLILHLFNGDDVKGTVDANTRIRCDHGQTTAAQTTTSAARAAGDGPGDDDHGDDDGGNQGDDDQGDDNGHHFGHKHHHGQPGCDATLLTNGRVVREAKLKATAGGLVFVKLEVVF
jgi:hypothetical protein